MTATAKDALTGHGFTASHGRPDEKKNDTGQETERIEAVLDESAPAAIPTYRNCLSRTSYRTSD